MKRNPDRFGRIQQKIDNGHLDEAYTMLLALTADHPEAFRVKLMLGELCNRMGRPEEAFSYFKLVASQHPDVPEYQYKLGLARRKAGKIEESLKYYAKALQLDPDYLAALNSQGLIYLELFDYDKAEENFLHVIKLKEEASGTHINLAKVYSETGRIKKSISHLEKAIALNPDVAFPYTNLAGVYLQACRQQDSLNACKKAIELGENDTLVYQNYLFNMHYSSEIGRKEIYEEHVKWARSVEVIKKRRFDNLALPNRRLRVAYVSSDLRRHSVGYFMRPIIAGHNRMLIEPYVYYNHEMADSVTNEFVGMLPFTWRDIHTLTRDQAIELIDEDRIDILVDLSGHTSGSRIELFTEKAAPIQMTYLGYPDTTGLSTIDYRITDGYADPEPEADAFYSEKLIRLSPTFLCYEPPEDLPPVRIREKSAKQAVIFGSFNMSSKLSKKTIALWSKILRTDDSYGLLLKSRAFTDEEVVSDVKEMFFEHGVQDHQLEIVGFAKHLQEHLDLYNRVDIALDTYPYHGTTTTFEALVMGCPVVSLQGDRHSARVGKTILINLGLDELLAQSEEEYVRIAVELAGNPERVVHYKRSLREMLLSSVLTDKKHFVENLEANYQQIWRQWCRGRELHTHVVQLNDDVRVVMPVNNWRRGFYELIEHETATGEEEHFLKLLVFEDTIILDVGAGIGQRSVFFAKYAKKVIAYEPSSDLAALLKLTVYENDAANIAVVEAGLGKQRSSQMFPYGITCNDSVSAGPLAKKHELVIEVALDDEIKRLGLSHIDLVYISNASGQQAGILAGAEEMLLQESPVVIVENSNRLEPGEQEETNHKLLRAAGYLPFRFVSSLEVLAPAAFSGFDQLTYYCKAETIQALQGRKLLVQNEKMSDAELAASVDLPQFFKQMSYFNAFKQLFPDRQGGRESTQVQYHQALERYLLSRDVKKTKEGRYCCLLGAYTLLKSLCERAPTLPRLFSLARMAQDIGDTEYGLGLLQLLFDLFESPDQLQINDYFLAVNRRFEQLDPGDNVGHWCLASVLESFVLLKARQVKTDQDTKQLEAMINLIDELGFSSVCLMKKKLFLSMENGTWSGDVPKMLLKETSENLNALWWQQLSST